MASEISSIQLVFGCTLMQHPPLLCYVQHHDVPQAHVNTPANSTRKLMCYVIFFMSVVYKCIVMISNTVTVTLLTLP